MDFIVSFMNDQYASVNGNSMLYNNISYDEGCFRFIVGKVADKNQILEFSGYMQSQRVGGIFASRGDEDY